MSQVYTVILNSNNKSGDNSFTYEFPSAIKFKPDSKIAMQSMSLYNSIFNVEAKRNNNKFTIHWGALVPTVHNFEIDNGNYSISDLNHLLQFFCIQHDLYLVDAIDSKNKYFLEIVVNANVYGVQLNSYAIPTSATASSLNLTIPTGATWDFPTTSTIPQLSFSSEFGSLLGFIGGIHPSATSTVDTTVKSTIVPQIAPVNSVLVGCNLIHSELSIPVDLFYSFSLNSAFGSLIEINQTALVYNSIRDGLYKNLVISLYDQAFNKIELHDHEVTIVLSIKV